MLFFMALTAAVITPTRFANPALAKTYRRAEFWDEGSATLLDIVNVIGRWQTAKEWSTRTDFVEVEDQHENTKIQAYSSKRYEMAQRLGQVERVALIQNAPKLRFRDEALAKGLGLTVQAFDNMEINPVAVNIVFDALAQSKNSLLPLDVVDVRRRGFVSPDGALNEAAFSAGLIKARALVIASWFVFGKGNFIGFLILLKVITDSTGVGGNLLTILLERQDLVVLGLGSAAAMAMVGQEEGKGAAAATVGQKVGKAADAPANN
jgi:hypothetical protein